MKEKNNNFRIYDEMGPYLSTYDFYAKNWRDAIKSTKNRLDCYEMECMPGQSRLYYLIVRPIVRDNNGKINDLATASHRGKKIMVHWTEPISEANCLQ